MHAAPSIAPALRARVVERLGLDPELAPDLNGLRTVYAAWCSTVPFDNIRKLVALRSGDTGPLPGNDATDFLEHFLAHGTGGTCWSSSNALFEVVCSFGFDARRVAGSMRDLGVPGHGSIKVRLDGSDWLVDSSMLMMYPIPLPDELHVDRHPLFGVEVEPADGSHLIWFDTPPYEEYFPCRLLLDPVDLPFYEERYELSRTRGPFNQHLSVRVNRDGARMVLQGHMRHRKTADGRVESTVLSPDALTDALLHEVGISPEMVQRFVDTGALAGTFEPLANPPAPLTGKPPSRRSP